MVSNREGTTMGLTKYTADGWLEGDVISAREVVERLGRRAAARYEADLCEADRSERGRGWTIAEMVAEYARRGWRKARA
jgi:hypothetical protein